MSGGHFGDYDYYKVHQFADELEVEIHNNNKPDEYGYVKNYSPETIKYLRKQLRQMRMTADIMRAVDYLYAADHDEDSFMVRVKDVERHHEENEKLVNQSYLHGWEDRFFGWNVPFDECKETGEGV